ncbi:hypothetical protein DBT_2376 [Dissulfuribacter thermophilus]|uniref:Uncharacterized protein n=1 Tax=Dissulfuribacter thermophilus TaxID=1156395 RepID=A0A1B9F324_9BACT|nr:hypothetical protein DBT_2376 [Dissulfuribacter thermophilus]
MDGVGFLTVPTVIPVTRFFEGNRFPERNQPGIYIFIQTRWPENVDADEI